MFLKKLIYAGLFILISGIANGHDLHLDPKKPITVIDKFQDNGVLIWDTKELGCFYLYKHIDVFIPSHSRLHIINSDKCKIKLKFP